MWKSYFASILRTFRKNRLYTILSITGLSLGFAAAILIGLFLRHELTYDKHHLNHDRIYRLESDYTIAGKHDLFAIVSFPLAPALKLEFPEIEDFVRFQPSQSLVLRYEDKEFTEAHLMYADSGVFRLFTHTLISGNADHALAEPGSIVLTRSMAAKYFDSPDPIGEVLTTTDNRSLKVTGVMEDLPSNSHLKYDALISMSTLSVRFGEEDFNSLDPNRFWNISPFAYIILKEGADMQSIFEKIKPFYEKYLEALGNQINASFRLMATRLDKIHYTSKLESDEPIGNYSYLVILGAIAIFLLTIAVINYMNMATARSAGRAREVGIRKISGASRKELVQQFLLESLTLSVLSLLVTLLILRLVMQDFNLIAGKEFTFSDILDPWFAAGIIVLVLLTGLLSGIYPAFFLSSFKPVSVFQGVVSQGTGSGRLRKMLVVFQFTLAIILIAGTLIASDQLNYMRDKDPGFNRDDIIVFNVPDTNFRNNMPSFRDELMRQPGIANVSASTGVPGDQRSIVVMRVEKDEGMVEHAINFIMADYNYIDLYQMELVQGRYFQKEMGTDLEGAVVINESAAKELGWEGDAIGKKIDFGIDTDGSARRNTKVIGVVKDFNYVSMHNPIEPICIFLLPHEGYIVSVKLSGGNHQEVISSIRETWDRYGASRPFDYYFLADQLSDLYGAEEKLVRIIRIFAVISVVIALLGMLGLSAFVTEKRTREVGLRKVLGATVSSILMLFYREFSILIGIAFVVSIPLVIIVLNRWLQEFAFHTDIHWIVFLTAGLFSWMVALVSVSYHVLRSASANPVNSIKYE